MALVKPSAIRELHKLEHDPEVISFCGGYPDASLFPVENLRETYQSVISLDKLAFQYTHSQGDATLRQQIADKMQAEGVACDADNIVVLQGAQQGLDFAGKMFIDEGDTVLIEAPTFLGALIAFNTYEPHYIGIPMDSQGIDPDALEVVLKSGQAVKFLYTIPDFQNPAGVTLSADRRRRLVDLANRYDFYIVEDSPYRDMRYSGASVPPIKSFDSQGRVIFLGSFSKSLVPGLRLGWAVADKEIVQNFAQLKQAADTQCSTINMKVASAYLKTFDHASHVENIVRHYRHKRDVMMNTIADTFPDSVAHTNPEGGMFTWLTFPAGFDADQFLKATLLPRAKVAYVPGVHFYADTSHMPVNNARLSFSACTDEAIAEGVKRMGDVLRSYLG
ncbi:PLP-dependent aminotransferase family protein [Paraburkholderia dipogonis]|uniref:PLP-dependent aminotransferase family protein n=2 Tax=Paraburkholderia dipogonis TaxID=1211383 RepID=A0A4Y8MXT9_9BURK|nr:PLP-dependent aminotransferase family protein [Paraburkholderia dipogonis]